MAFVSLAGAGLKLPFQDLADLASQSITWNRFLFNTLVLMKYPNGSAVRGFSLGATAGVRLGLSLCLVHHCHMMQCVADSKTSTVPEALWQETCGAQRLQPGCNLGLCEQHLAGKHSSSEVAVLLEQCFGGNCLAWTKPVSWFAATAAILFSSSEDQICRCHQLTF